MLRDGLRGLDHRIAYGPGFATPTPVDDDTCVADLGETAVRYLLADATG